MLKLKMILIAIFCLTLPEFTSSAVAQYADLGLEPAIGIELPNLGYSTIRGERPINGCPNTVNQINITFPFNTGSADLDKLLYNDAISQFNKLALNDYCNPSDIQPIYYNDFRYNFVAKAPSKRYLSLLFSYFEYYAGTAHPSSTTKAIVYDLDTGKAVELSDIFQLPDQAIPKLWEIVVSSWCRLDKGSLPNYYNLSPQDQTCGSGLPPIPSSFRAKPTPFSALGKVLLTREGMTIVIDAYEGWSYADGEQRIDIPKADLISLGAYRIFWE
jgi:hypothetical protein